MKTDVGFVEDGVQAIGFLFFVVFQCLEGNVAKQDDDNDIDDCLESHGDIGQCPCDGHGVTRPDEYHQACQDAEYIHDGFVSRDEQDVAFGVEIVADNRGKGKKNNRNGDDVDADGT